jgi:acetoacetyl-CoA synthetase
MAAVYVEAVRALQPAGPYALAGYSFGGLVAFEMARALRAAGDVVEFLGLIDGNLHHDCLRGGERLAFRAARPARYARTVLAAPRTLPLYARSALGRLPAANGARRAAGPPLAQHFADIAWEAFYAYEPGPYAGAASFFEASIREPGLCDPVPVWRRLVEGGLSVERVPGGHVEMMREPHVGALAARFGAHLAATR